MTHSPAGGFTLVELLVTISIMALLSSMVLVAMAGVQKTSRKHRTRAQITRLHTLISERMDTYETRRMPVDTTGMRATRAAMVRLAAKRELIRMEMPERILDVLDDPVILSRLPALNLSYRSRASQNWSSANEGAECLYLILSRVYVDESNALEFFSEGEIGDIDNDGMPEVLDAWGNPISFLRWAPGLGTVPVSSGIPQADISLLQGDGRRVDPSTGKIADGTFDMSGWKRDRLDVMEADDVPRAFTDDAASMVDDDLRPFNLVPLIFSAGPDREYNIAVGVKTTSGEIVHIHYGQSDDGDADDVLAVMADGSPDPFFVFTQGDGREFRIGEVADPQSKGHQDNIHNHFIEAR